MSRFLLLALLMLLPGVASAHAILLDSQPAARGVAAAGPARITLRFNSRIDRARSRLVLRAAGQERALPLVPTGADDVLEAQADLQPGDWVLRWQVLAVDGHITRGDVPFQVKAAQVQSSRPGAVQPALATADVPSDVTHPAAAPPDAAVKPRAP